MSQLWPRLSAGPARVLHDERRTLGVEALADLSSAEHPRRTYAATGGARVSDGQVLALVRELRSGAEEFGYPAPSDDHGRTAFDRAASEVLFRHMQINTVEGANDEVWNFLALVAAPDIVRWRWPESKNVERWISSDRTRHMYARLWWQALTFVEFAIDGRPDFSLLRSLTERDLNQITERRSIGGVPRLARAVARMASTGGSRDSDGSRLVRRITPPLRRRITFIDFSALTDEQIDDQLRAISAELPPSSPSGRQVEAAVGRPSSPRRNGAATSARAPSVTTPSDEKPSSALSTEGAGTETERPTMVDLCAGAGGLALGLEQAGFDPVLLIDNRQVACETLRANRPDWDVRELDLQELQTAEHPTLHGVDLLAAGLPRVQAPATANRLRGSSQELELLEDTIRLVIELRPAAVLIDNVPDLVTKDQYSQTREIVQSSLTDAGYAHRWLVVNAADHGVSQDRRHGVLVAFRDCSADRFELPPALLASPTPVGELLKESMASRGWPQAEEWAEGAKAIAPTIVGGSWDRGGADLGPTGTKRAWARLGVDGGTVADAAPEEQFRWNPDLGRAGLVALTVEQVARLQGFPDDWVIAGRKTARYRQIAEATPPPLAEALGRGVRAMLAGRGPDGGFGSITSGS